ncbi:1-acyl-sn-glycerol-3-phosphate acyltransferase [Ruminococcus sp.]|uniref:lysophospholipid acyltransferase family protein n=1 Tax=Ruminococcus sp. TaxID=41978 RepID=UPI002600E2C3|nr:1-acyl-sn-glycerol-3-phosphate acyltransferase [Ruminococcus sp.]MBQ8966836.1 hypothetical protein [Ruminococcus sp.]
MSLKNKKRDMTPFDMKRRPVKQNIFLTPLLWAVSYILTRKQGLRKVSRIRMKGLEPPYLVFATHQGFSDYYIAPRALFPHRANYISDMEGFAAFGNWLYRRGGCIGKRRYVADTAVLNNVKYALFTLKQPVVIFPESRHCDAGVTSCISNDIGRLAKHFGLPVAVISAHGSYLANPFWDEAHERRSKISAEIEQVFTAEEVKRTSAEVIQAEIEKRLKYDEYSYQLQEHISINYPKRAEGLQLPLYKCISCKAEGSMAAAGTKLSCRACGKTWEMTEYGQLREQESGKLLHIPDWYRWERRETEKEIEADGYLADNIVTVEALPNEKGFVPLGKGRLEHSSGGYVLYLDDTEQQAVRNSPDSFPVRVKAENLVSAQTEYNYRGRGKCIVLSTKNCCYYCYGSEPDFIVTKQEFAQEYFYRKNKLNKKEV